jgi:L-alanine-DL-glutamate epimerase-like enolase superfamily enzyme
LAQEKLSLHGKSPEKQSQIGEQLDSVQDVDRLMNTIISPTNTIRLFEGNPAALAGLEQALDDVISQQTKTALTDIHQAKQTPIPFSKSIGIYDTDQTLIAIQNALDEGFKTIRLKLGAQTVNNTDGKIRDIEVVTQGSKLIEQSQTNARLVADANQGFVDCDARPI